MHATHTSSLSTENSRAVFIPTQKSPVADTTGFCACGQQIDARHSRCTRCGR